MYTGMASERGGMMIYLIDRNKLYNYIRAQINPYGNPFTGSIQEFGHELMDYLLDMEKVDAVPVVHGEWYPYKISKIFSYTCNVCHCDVKEKTPFCPYCGAKMDGKKVEE